MPRKVYLILSVLLFMMAAGMVAYPLASNYAAEKYASTIRTEHFAAVEELDDAAIKAAREAAAEYNRTLSVGVTQTFSDDALTDAYMDYESLLNLTGDGVMAYVEIPKLDIYLPVSHGTEAETLESGIGHVIGSSLPIGGEGTHAVLSGHSGLASQKMFSDLDQLRAGDVFYLHVLGETLAYAVEEINTVLPSDTALLKLEEGRDLVTLVTCTPFGVNTHRLLARGSRVPYAPEEVAPAEEPAEPEPVRSTWRMKYLIGILMGIGVLGLGLAGYITVTRLWKRRGGWDA